MKRIVFLIIASLLVVGLIMPGMVSAQNPTVKVLIAGPMEYMQGKDMYDGAELAATEINDAGGIDVGGQPYDILLVEVETDEIDNYAEAGIKLADAISTNPDAQFIIGGFRTEGVSNMIPEAMGANVTMFICGAATYSLLAEIPWEIVQGYGPGAAVGTPYYRDYAVSAGYEWIYRGTPFNEVFLLGNSFMMMQMVGLNLVGQGITPRVAIMAESLDWADAIVEAAEALIPTLGWEVGHIARVSDKASSTVMDPELNAIEADKCNMIWTVMSGQVGSVFSLRKGALDIPALAVGINVEAQSPSFWGDTNGGCEYEITLGVYAPNVRQNDPLTGAFLDAFELEYGRFPSYTAGSYDILNVLATAIDEVNSVDNEDLTAWYEDIANKQDITVGTSAQYPPWDGSTLGEWKGYHWPALNSTQITAIYGDASNYAASCNFTMPPFSTHDLIYGPDYVTGIGVQWQEAV